MNIDNLLKNICDQIKEAQIKLGYVKETVRLYYPLESLQAILGTKYDDSSELIRELETEPDFYDGVLGTLSVRGKRRLEICIPPEGAEYVYTQFPEPAFLVDLIHLFQTNHHCHLSDIEEVFAQYSKAYICQKMPEGSDFDYVLFFIDKSIDGYYYCIKDEMNHTIYHRFSEEDYRLMID